MAATQYSSSHVMEQKKDTGLTEKICCGISCSVTTVAIALWASLIIAGIVVLTQVGDANYYKKESFNPVAQSWEQTNAAAFKAKTFTVSWKNSYDGETKPIPLTPNTDAEPTMSSFLAISGVQSFSPYKLLSESQTITPSNTSTSVYGTLTISDGSYTSTLSVLLVNKKTCYSSSPCSGYYVLSSICVAWEGRNTTVSYSGCGTATGKEGLTDRNGIGSYVPVDTLPNAEQSGIITIRDKNDPYVHFNKVIAIMEVLDFITNIIRRIGAALKGIAVLAASVPVFCFTCVSGIILLVVFIKLIQKLQYLKHMNSERLLHEQV